MRMMLVALAILVALILAIFIVGWALPVRHRATRQATLPAPPGAVFDAITRVEEFPAWRSKVKTPGRRLVSRIADPSLPFGGT